MKKMSLAVRTRFSSRFLAALVLHLSSSSIMAGEDDFFLKELLKQQQPNMNRQLPDWLKTKPMQLSPSLEKILREGSRIANPGSDNDIDTGKRSLAQAVQGRWIFVSFGMPMHEMKAAAEEAAATKSILVFRGVEKDQNTGSITKKLLPIVRKLKPVPGAVIDPTLFTRFNITAVPTIVETDAEGKTRSARGLPGFDWLSKQEPGDHGQRGPIYGILEPDMIEEIQRRAANVDWEKQKTEAIANFWKKQDEFNLRPAEKTRERAIDMTIVSTQDIFHPDGRLIIKKGDRINPQAMMPMRHAYIIFDATSKKQVEIAKKAGDEILKKGKPVIYLFSKIDKERGWSHYNETGDFVNGPLYKLNKSIMDRFKLEVLPTVIEGQGDHVVAKEFASGEVH
jgi:conjugal transfer pilus assembly protein TraW